MAALQLSNVSLVSSDPRVLTAWSSATDHPRANGPCTPQVPPSTDVLRGPVPRLDPAAS